MAAERFASASAAPAPLGPSPVKDAPTARAPWIAAALLMLAACSTPPSGPAPRPDAPGEWIAVSSMASLYVERGGSGPPLVLIPGAGMDLRMWAGVLPILEESYEVIRYDPRGVGLSDWVEGAFDHPTDLAKLLDDLGLDRVHLAGLGEGGRIALDMALAHPGRVESLCLASPLLSGHDPDSADGAEVRRTRRSNIPSRVASAWLRHPRMAPAMEHRRLAPLVTDLVEANAANWLRMDRERPLLPSAAARLGDVTQPVLLTMGSRDTRDQHSVALLLESQVPLLVRRDVPDASHLLAIERPEWFAAALLDFLEHVAAG